MDLPPFNMLSLASGYGGLDLGFKMAYGSARTICYVEIEAYACEVLASRMEEGRLDPAPIWTDLRTFDGSAWRGVVDCILAGYPCQPWSVAGRRLGADDPRHLWPHVARVIRETGAPLVFLENVAGHLSLGAREVIGELQDMGYRVAAGLFRALEVGAPHRRERLFLLAHHHHYGRESERCGRLLDGERASLGNDVDGCGGAPVGNTDGLGRQGRGVRGVERLYECAPWPPGPSDALGWREYLARRPTLEPSILRGAHGNPNRVDRLRACGNGVVPEQAALAFRTLWTELRSNAR